MDDLQLQEVRRLSVPAGEFSLACNADRTAAALSCVRMAVAQTAGDIHHLIRSLEISEGLIEGADAEIARLLAEGKPVQRVLIARGKEARDGTDARIVFKKRPLGAPVHIEADAERVDYREIYAVDNTKAGECIGTVTPHSEGIAGVDVFGKVVPARSGTALNIAAGPGVRFDPETLSYFAEQDGYVVFQQNTLSVENVYRVRGDVTLRHGNIRFVGAVEVGRDVPDEFTIESGKGILIGGTAEACTLRSGQHILIQGGMTGKGKGKIEAAGRVKVRFLSETEVVCGGDVIVHKEIVNSRVFTLGRLIMPQGAVRGSLVVALKGILVGEAGSEMGSRSQLTAGMDYKVYERLVGVNHDLREAQERQQEILNRLGPLLTKLVHSPSVPAKEAESAQLWMRDARQLQRKIERLQAESTELVKSFRDKSIDTVTVVGTVQPGVRVIAGKAELEFEKPRPGPVSFFPDPETGQVRVESGRLVEEAWAREGYPPLGAGL